MGIYQCPCRPVKGNTLALCNLCCHPWLPQPVRHWIEILAGGLGISNKARVVCILQNVDSSQGICDYVSQVNPLGDGVGQSIHNSIKTERGSPWYTPCCKRIRGVTQVSVITIALSPLYGAKLMGSIVVLCKENWMREWWTLPYALAISSQHMASDLCLLLASDRTDESFRWCSVHPGTVGINTFCGEWSR